jgi:mRNA interferase HigB
MQIVGREVLHEFVLQHADAATAANAWLAEVDEAEWKTPNDVKQRYPHASMLSGKRVIFNLKGNRYRLEVKISYQNQIVLIKRAGTHAEYSRWKL